MSHLASDIHQSQTKLQALTLPGVEPRRAKMAPLAGGQIVKKPKEVYLISVQIYFCFGSNRAHVQISCAAAKTRLRGQN